MKAKSTVGKSSAQARRAINSRARKGTTRAVLASSVTTKEALGLRLSAKA
jgi:hypothetical protein